MACVFICLSAKKWQEEVLSLNVVGVAVQGVPVFSGIERIWVWGSVSYIITRVVF